MLESIAGEDRPQREIGDREVGEHLGEQRAREPVDGDALEPEQLVGDEPARAEREDHRDRRRERRRDQRQQHARVDRGEERRAAGAPRAAVNANRKPSTVPASPTSARSSRLFQNARTGAGRSGPCAMPAVVKRAVVEQHPREQHRERIDDEQREQQPTARTPCRRRPGRAAHVPRAVDARPAKREPPRAARYGFRTSATQRSTMRLRLAPA